MRRNVIKALHELHAVPIESRVRAGVPDVAYINGWIELKWLRDWPKRVDTIVRIHHYTQQQRIWLRRHWELGGNSWLLLQVKREWLLFDGPTAYMHVGNLDRLDLTNHAMRYWDNGLKPVELREFLEVQNGRNRVS